MRVTSVSSHSTRRIGHPPLCEAAPRADVEGAGELEGAGEPEGQAARPAPFGLERRFDPGFVAALALRETQVQQSYRPIIGIHKWFARRPGSLFRGLLLAEFVDAPLRESYWQSNDVAAKIADPFMGGGTTVFEGLRLGLGVVGCDVNPMSHWLVRQAVEPLDLVELRVRAAEVIARTSGELGSFYQTACTMCGCEAPIKYFMWAKICPCPACGEQVALHPGYLVAEAVRHPRNVYHCPTCETLSEQDPGVEPECSRCSRPLGEGNVRRGKAECLSCSTVFAFSKQLTGACQVR